MFTFPPTRGTGPVIIVLKTERVQPCFKNFFGIFINGGIKSKKNKESNKANNNNYSY